MEFTMAGLLIGDIARRVGLTTSAIRYYERAGLLPPPARHSGQRRYEPQAVGRVRMIQIARQAGFSIAETRLFLTGFSAATAPNARWRALAERKLAEFDSLITRVESMKTLLESGFRCECPRIEDCERAIAAFEKRGRSCVKTPSATGRRRRTDS
jgi:MerR family transcriptional regulator, redox-sensitive transcriptional activator SoxR